MKPLTSRQGEQQLHNFAAARGMLAFDYDGTLAPFAVKASHAKMRASTARLFEAVCRRYPCVVISGRGRRDLAKLVTPSLGATLIGNHGMERVRRRARDAAWKSAVQGWLKTLAPRLVSLPGVFLEDKGLSLCVHYRGVPDAPAVARAVRAATADLASVRRVRGKLLLNLVPADAPHKGDALLEAMAAAGCECALFVGDDVTDEDCFRLASNRSVLGVRVGRSERSRAAFFLENQAQIDWLLGRLLALRPRLEVSILSQARAMPLADTARWQGFPGIIAVSQGRPYEGY